MMAKFCWFGDPGHTKTNITHAVVSIIGLKNSPWDRHQKTDVRFATVDGRNPAITTGDGAKTRRK